MTATFLFTRIKLSVEQIGSYLLVGLKHLIKWICNGYFNRLLGFLEKEAK